MQDVQNNLIAGEWLTGDNSIENINPSDLTDVVGHFAQADADQLEATLDQARIAQTEWATYGLERKQNVLMAIGNEMMARADELGELLCREDGKPRAEGKGEVFRAGQFFTYYAAECLRQIGENADSVQDGVEIDIRREPLGTVAIISPWNFLTATASWKIAPALCYGNAVVWKPANITPASAVALTGIINRQDMPKGLFSLVMGSGSTIGQRLLENPKVNAISFTGSVPVGNGIASAAIQNLTNVQMEMGSKNALAVMDDADLNLAATSALGDAFGGRGDSSYGPREQCKAAAEYYTTVKTAYISAGTPR